MTAHFTRGSAQRHGEHRNEERKPAANESTCKDS
jgi:hypothetical protein